MAYAIDRYNNTLLTTVEDGTVDQTTDLKFIGKNYAGYGEIQNENFLFLLENFSGANQPARPISGQVWFDSGTSKLKFYDGTQWRTTGGAEIGATEPTGLANGDFWWDSGNDQLYVYNGTSFVLIGPQNAGEGVTQMTSLEVLDTTSATRGIIASVIEDETIFVVSPTQFDLNASQTALISQGFDRINKGVTLRNTKLATAGVTSTTDRFHGTATNAEKLGGVIAANFVQTGGASTVFTSTIEAQTDDGILIGASQDFQFKIDTNGFDGVIQNTTNSGDVKLKITSGAGVLTHVASVTETNNVMGITPAVSNTFTLGTTDLKWSTVYATNFAGRAAEATALMEGSNPRLANSSATNNTVVVRDGTGNVAANLFQGVATQARYADLAEKYTTAEELPAGTAVAVCTHEDHEVEPASASNHCIGVVSTDPAYMMNSEAEGQYIGLKGRLPVRVKGAVRKGDVVYAMADGVCTTISTTAMVGIALESNSDESEKLVECVLKV
jgi:hypothetical protein